MGQVSHADRRRIVLIPSPQPLAPGPYTYTSSSLDCIADRQRSKCSRQM